MGESLVQGMVCERSTIFKNTHTNDFITDGISCFWHLLNYFPIQLFIKYVLSTYYVPVTVLGDGCTGEQNRQSAIMELMF